MVGWFWLIWENQTRLKIADGCCQQFSNVPGLTIKIGLPVVKWKPVSFCETKSGFKLKNFHIWWNLNWFHRFIVILVVFFFVTWFQGPKIRLFLAKNHHKRGFRKLFFRFLLFAIHPMLKLLISPLLEWFYWQIWALSSFSSCKILRVKKRPFKHHRECSSPIFYGRCTKVSCLW